jgi:flavin reductase (DIM6/NTAB) family NADH-FMN oxidoreductase RutF
MSWFDQRPDDAMAGAFTIEPPVSIRTVSQQVFREGMARLGAAVHIITTAGAGGATGLTATAVCSVSDSPATLLVCVNRSAMSGSIIAENGVFCVNTLAAGQEAIADYFAKRSNDKSHVFAHEEWLTLATGSPVMESAVMSFDCRLIELKPVASHNIFFGAVEAVRQGAAGPALVYHERAYKQV